MNLIGLNNRTSHEVNHKWKDLKSLAKKDLSARKNPGTGGGNKRKEGPYTELVLDIIGLDSPCLMGVGGGIETGVEQETLDSVTVTERHTQCEQQCNNTAGQTSPSPSIANPIVHGQASSTVTAEDSLLDTQRPLCKYVCVSM